MKNSLESFSNVLQKTQKNYWEILVFFMIFFAFSQTILEELSIILIFPGRIRQSILIFGFFFDLFFVIEFLIRLITAIKSKKFIKYLLFDRGFLDLLASLPVLLLYSAPLFFKIMNIKIFKINYIHYELYNLTLLKGCRLIIVSGILRLLRIVNIFGNSIYKNSIIAKENIIKGLTIFISIVVLSVTLSNFFFPIISYDIEKVKNNYQKHLKQTFQFIQMSDELDLNYENINKFTKKYIKEQFESYKDFILLEIKTMQDEDWGNSIIVYSKYSEKEFREKFIDNDLHTVEFLNIRIVLTNLQYQISKAKLNLIISLIIIFFILFYQIIYGKYFTKNISDKIILMLKGFKNKKQCKKIIYNKNLENSELKQLIEQYNIKWLDYNHDKEKNAE